MKKEDFKEFIEKFDVNIMALMLPIIGIVIYELLKLTISIYFAIPLIECLWLIMLNKEVK